MSKSITKGNWSVQLNNSPYNHKVICSGIHEESLICEMVFGHRNDDINSIISNDELEANAELIAEAGTVYNESGMGPMDMKEKIKAQRKDLETSRKMAKDFEKRYWDAVQQSDARLEALKVAFQMIQKRKYFNALSILKAAINGEPSPTSQRVEDLEEALGKFVETFTMKVDKNNPLSVHAVKFLEESIPEEIKPILSIARKALSGKESRNQKLEEKITHAISIYEDWYSNKDLLDDPLYDALLEAIKIIKS